MWMVGGSQCEPIYPDLDGVSENGDWGLCDIEPIAGASHPDESLNRLARVAHKYAGREVKVEAQPGDVVFFNGHILHRSHSNRSKTQSRHTFVGHYCNARSLVPWNYKSNSYEGDSANYPAHPCAWIDPPALCAAALRYALRREPPRSVRQTS